MARTVTLIPADKVKGQKKRVSENKKIRVAAYCRVSTDQDDQLLSFANQVEYYTNYINDHPEYELAGVYADEGISGTNTKRREQFKQMIEDCEDGRIDMVITKSISRFARNTADCLMYSRKLKNLGIGIFFEKEHINTLDASGEVLFTILSSLAQDESRNISENCKWGIRTKFKKGIPHINADKFLGYDKVDGKLVINEEQAKTVRRIYTEFIQGYNPSTIAERLTEEGVPGCQGQVNWYIGNIVGILRNEKHMGDALLQKTFTSDFLTKKQVKNTGQMEQVYIEGDHEAIIDKDTWEAVQLELDRREEYKKEHNLQFYGYRANKNSFSCKIICGYCNSIYGRKSWNSRGVHVWQCNKRFKEKGVVGCRGENIKEEKIYQAFVQAWNQLLAKKEKLSVRWKRQIKEGSPLERLRAMQMIEVTSQPSIKSVIPELVQLVLEKVIVRNQGELEFYFLDGNKVLIKIK